MNEHNSSNHSLIPGHGVPSMNAAIWVRHIGNYICWFNIVVGVLGNTLSLLAFLTQLKSNRAYFHQIFLVLADFCTLMSFFVGLVGIEHLGVGKNRAPNVIQKSKFLLQFFCAGFVWTNIFSTAELIIFVGVSADRLYALSKPLKYRNVNKKRNATVIAILGILIGMGVGFPGFFYFKIEYDEVVNKYIAVRGFEWARGAISKILEALRIILRFGCVITIMILAGLISTAYARNKKRQKQLRTRNSVQSKETVSEESLTMLLIGQAMLVLIGQLPIQVFYAAIILFNVNRYSSLGRILGMIANVSGTMQISWNCFVYFCMSKQFRLALKSCLLCRQLSDQVLPVVEMTPRRALAKSRIQGLDQRSFPRREAWVGNRRSWTIEIPASAVAH